jgi:hypothetical protein
VDWEEREKTKRGIRGRNRKAEGIGEFTLCMLYHTFDCVFDCTTFRPLSPTRERSFAITYTYVKMTRFRLQHGALRVVVDLHIELCLQCRHF